MSDDVLRTIDEIIAANEARFCPVGWRPGPAAHLPQPPVQPLTAASGHRPGLDCLCTTCEALRLQPPAESALDPECGDRHLNAVTDRWVLCNVRSSDPHRHTDGMSTWEESNPPSDEFARGVAAVRRAREHGEAGLDRGTPINGHEPPEFYMGALHDEPADTSWVTTETVRDVPSVLPIAALAALLLVAAVLVGLALR